MLDFMTYIYDSMKIYWYIVLFTAFVIDSIIGSMSGGAGMITMPILLLSELNPIVALASC